MGTDLEAVLERLVKDKGLLDQSEEATRQAAVLPILSQLGWNTYDIREVTPEYQPEKGRRVDYCLQIDGKKYVYIEVKRATEELERHERQLLEYAFGDDVRLAALTNGYLWWLYLPRASGNWQQRRFFAVDICEQESVVAAKNFETFLSRAAVASESALRQAESAQKGKERKRVIDETMPSAWRLLFDEPDKQLLDLLAAKVEGMCGHRPDPEDVAEFVRDQMAPSKPTSFLPVSPTPGRRDPSPTPRKGRGRSKQYGTVVRVGDRTITATSVSDFYRQSLRYLVDNGHIKALNRFLPYATGARRYLLSTKPVHPGGNSFRLPVGYKGYFLEAHKDYTNAIKNLKDMLAEVNLSVEEIGTKRPT